MYNSEIKKQYIEEKEEITKLSPGYLNKIFEKTASFEIELNKDICNFNFYEIENMYKTLNYVAIDTLINLHCQISLYTQWCLKRNLVTDCQSHYAEIRKEQLFNYINKIAFDKTVIDKKTLYSWVDELLNASDAFLLLALYEGIKGDGYCELIDLKMSDFKENEVQLCTGRKLTVSNKLLSLAEDSYKAEYYVSNNNRQFPFLPSELIIKNNYNVDLNANEHTLGRRIYRKVIRCFEILTVEKHVMPNDIYESGGINFILEQSKLDEMAPIDWLTIPENVEKYKERYAFDKKNFFISKIIDKYKEYLV